MQSFTDLLQQGTANAWLFVPTAILLGALHGLEPGHSKTMMAAFIVAIRGTTMQAVLLGLSAAVSHTAIVWLVALGGQYLGRNAAPEAIEPYLQLAAGTIVAGVAVWTIWRTRRDRRLEREDPHDRAHRRHDDDHHHYDEEARRIDTGHGVVALEIFEQGVPPRWRVRFESGHGWPAKDVSVDTERADGTRQAFAFTDRGDFLESLDTIPEPHAFVARVSLGHGGHAHDYDVPFVEGHGLRVAEGSGYMDAHERAHADDIAHRFRDRRVTTGQIVIFGLTGGLVPCPASITVLLLCLQLKQLTLGIVLVACFSIGLALTMVSAGIVAALSVQHVQKRWSGFSTFARRAPYGSGVLMLLVAAYMAVSGWIGLTGGHT